MGRFFSSQLYRRVALGILNKQPDTTDAATHVDGGDCCVFANKTALMEAQHGLGFRRHVEVARPLE